MSNEFEQLQLLKEWTKIYGALHDAQVEQLRYWPLTLTHATKAEVLFNFDSRTVIYNIQKTKGKMPKDLGKRLKILEYYTKWLLGDEYSVIVQKGESVWFYSEGIVNGLIRESEQSTRFARELSVRGGKGGFKGMEAKKGTSSPTKLRNKDV